MPFPPPHNHKIPLAEAAAMTKRYRDEGPKGAETAQMFPREVLEALLSQPGAMGVRFYFGRHAAGGPISMVAVAVDANGNDLDEGDLVDRSFPCPPWCSSPNPLNT